MLAETPISPDYKVYAVHLLRLLCVLLVLGKLCHGTVLHLPLIQGRQALFSNHLVYHQIDPHIQLILLM